MLSVLIFVVESLIILFFIPNTRNEIVHSVHSPREEKTVVHHMNIGYLSTIRAKVDVPIYEYFNTSLQ